MQAVNPSYRSDIDGLRAIAVLGVIFYHARFTLGTVELFSGGFVGVDVFFVISGYLITSIILREHLAGGFCFGRFYERRVRRILPALFLMLLVTLPFAVLLMGAQALTNYASSGLSSLAFVANIRFWLEDSYTADPSALKPLLHTWSLSVEEQFYLLYPPLLIGIGLLRRHVVAMLLTALLASLVLSHIGSKHFANAAFFLLPTRGWELLAGAVLASWELQRNAKVIQTKWASLLATTGLLLILATFISFDDNMRHPSFLTLMPVAGTLLLILFGDTEGITHKLLSCKTSVATGLLSYSLYLWHFPVLAFARIADVNMTMLNTTALLVFSTLLAFTSYHLVEKPARNPARVPARRLCYALGGAALLLASGFLGLYLYGKQEMRSFRINDSFFDISFETAKRYQRAYDSCGSWEIHDCARPVEDKVNILIVGDSMALDVINMLAPQYPDYHFAFSSLGGCPPAPHIAGLVRRDHPELALCLQLNEARFRSGSIDGFDGVIIDTQMSWFTAEDLRPYLEFLSQEGMQNVFVASNYLQLTQDFTEIIEEHDSTTFPFHILEPVDYISESASKVALQNLVADFGYGLLDLGKYACAMDGCRLFVGDYPFSWDKFHFSVEFAEYLGTAMKDELSGSWLDRLNETEQ